MINYIELLKSASIVGVATLITGASLQGAYTVTGFTPPAPIFWFFTGFSAYLAIEGAEHVIGRELITNKGHALSSRKRKRRRLK